MAAERALEIQNQIPRLRVSSVGMDLDFALALSWGGAVWPFLTFLGCFDVAISFADHVSWPGKSKVWHI